MTRALLAIALALLCGACAGPLRRPSAPVADASPECYRSWVASLDPLDTGVRWEADPNDPAAWDDLADPVLRALVERLAGAERSRVACVDFINSLKRRGVIRAPVNGR